MISSAGRLGLTLSLHVLLKWAIQRWKSSPKATRLDVEQRAKPWLLRYHVSKWITGSFCSPRTCSLGWFQRSRRGAQRSWRRPSGRSLSGARLTIPGFETKQLWKLGGPCSCCGPKWWVLASSCRNPVSSSVSVLIVTMPNSTTPSKISCMLSSIWTSSTVASMRSCVAFKSGGRGFSPVSQRDLSGKAGTASRM